MAAPRWSWTVGSPLGALHAAADADGAIVGLGTAPWDAPADDGPFRALGEQLARYFAREPVAFDVPLAPEGTPFQKRVWDELRRIPYGRTIAYGELARRLGGATLTRAVGRANGANPVMIVVPCHRVIGANGDLVGYAGGLATKHALLRLEGALLL